MDRLLPPAHGADLGGQSHRRSLDGRFSCSSGSRCAFEEAAEPQERPTAENLHIAAIQRIVGKHHNQSAHAP